MVIVRVLVIRLISGFHFTLLYAIAEFVTWSFLKLLFNYSKKYNAEVELH